MSSTKKPQPSFGDSVPSFNADPRAARLGRSIVEVAGDAMLRKYGSFEDAAKELDAIFGPEGRPVSATVLRAALRNAERNYFRAEWLVVVLEDAEVRATLAPPAKSPAEELAELREHMAMQAPGELARFDRRRRGLR